MGIIAPCKEEAKASKHAGLCGSNRVSVTQETCASHPHHLAGVGQHSVGTGRDKHIKRGAKANSLSLPHALGRSSLRVFG